MSNFQELEIGSVLEVSAQKGNLFIDVDYKVYADRLPVGDLIGNLTWFSESRAIEANSIEQIVYMGNYKWSIKHLVNPVDEFFIMDDDKKEAVLKEYLSFKDQEMQEFIAMQDVMTDMDSPYEMHPHPADPDENPDKR